MSIRMKTGKLLAVVAIAATMSVGVCAFAQQGAPGGGGGQGRRQGGGRGFQPSLSNTPATVLADGLKLTAIQKAKIQAIQDQYRKDATALRPAQGEQPAPDFREKMQALNEETTKSIEAVLTPDQVAKAPAFLASVGKFRVVGIPLEVLPDLKLTADQKTKIGAIADTAQKKMQEAFQQNQGNGGGGGGFQAIQEMMKANRDAAAAVLTASQKATLDKYNAAHPQRGFGGPGGGGGGRRGGGGAGAPGNGPV